MESFALFTNAKLLGKKASTLLMVSDSFTFTDKLSSLEMKTIPTRQNCITILMR